MSNTQSIDTNTEQTETEQRPNKRQRTNNMDSQTITDQSPSTSLTHTNDSASLNSDTTVTTPVVDEATPATISTSSSTSTSTSTSTMATPVDMPASTNTTDSSSSQSVSMNSPSRTPSTSTVASDSTAPKSTSSKQPSKSCILRLQSDYKALENDPPEGVSASPVDATLLHWKACIFGPSDSEWEGGIFQMQINFPLEYPQKPPSVRFISKIFHPNVFADGNLCLDIIQDHWSPIYTVSTILTSIQSLLTDPNPASPANPDAAKLWAQDKKEYRKRVRACVAKCST